MALTVIQEYGIWRGEFIPVTPERSQLPCRVTRRDDLGLMEVRVAEGQGVTPNSMWVRRRDLPPTPLTDELDEAAQSGEPIELDLALRVEDGVVYFDAIWTGDKKSAVPFFANRELARVA